SIALAAAPPGSAKGRFRLVQQGDPFDLSVPLRIRLASGETRQAVVRVRDRETAIDPAATAVAEPARQVELDPDLRLWRRLDTQALPPIFRETFISPRSQVLVAGGAEWTAPAMQLAGRLLESQLQPVSEDRLLASTDLPALVVGDRDSVSGLVARLGLGALPQVLLQEVPAPATGAAAPLKGTAQAWTARAPNGKTLVFVMAADVASLQALQRSMPHYGRQSWLVFDAGRVVGQGAWPVAVQSLSLE
ncbi:MAG TPA: hypothetical protein VKP68_13345, partial [Ramlibacter sp.]|nr:hypothetical protein [Ramlibacter sp.]